MWLGAGNRSGTLSQFPLKVSANGRYLVTASGNTPKPILGRALWGIVGLTQSAYQTVVDDTVTRGFTAIELQIPNKDPAELNIPFANNGALLPWSKRLDGGTWSGTLTYGTPATEAPDFTTTNETYWQFIDTFLDYCDTKGLLVIMGNCYNGFGGSAQNNGWLKEMVANGTTNMQTYGTFIGNRFKNRKNLVWLLAGDYGSGANSYTVGEANVMDAYTTGLTSVVKQSTLYTADPNSNSISTDITATGTQAVLNIVGGYSFNEGNIAQRCRDAYGTSKPAFLLECGYDEEGPDGNNVNPTATQPVRRFYWYGWLSAIAGYIHGNGFVWIFQSGYSTHLNSTGTQDMTRMNNFITSVPWYRLVPDGLGGIGTLVTAGGGTIDNSNSATAACTPEGDLLVCYLAPSHSGSVTIDMTKMRGTVTARWFDPTNASYSAIGSFSNSGTHAFTPSGNNSAGEGDWVLRLDA